MITLNKPTVDIASEPTFNGEPISKVTAEYLFNTKEALSFYIKDPGPINSYNARQALQPTIGNKVYTVEQLNFTLLFAEQQKNQHNAETVEKMERVFQLHTALTKAQDQTSKNQIFATLPILSGIGAYVLKSEPLGLFTAWATAMLFLSVCSTPTDMQMRHMAKNLYFAIEDDFKA